MGFDEVFARQIEALAEPGDLLVLHSTSGESPNVIRAAQAAKARGVGVVALLGRSGGPLKEIADLVLHRALDRDGAHSGAASRDRARDL